MKGRLLILLTIVVMVVLLVALNAASYVRVEQEGETEFAPDRSTLNAGRTGTRALFDYLQQKGVDVVRWKQPMSSLAEAGEAQRPSTFVIVGRTRHPVEKREADAILRWVRRGGRLVVIDRSPNASLLPTSGRWRVGSEMFESPGPGVRPDDMEQMTRGAALIAPAQPTALTQDVKEVARSRFAGRLHIYQTGPVVVSGGGIGPAPPPARAISVATPTPDPDTEDDIWGEEGEEEPPASPGVGSEDEEDWEDWEDADSAA
ncbi:MAG: DUF4350 domain-containing protein, partial [Rubrivivax sp.]|nr:DUF4350 domain-containing protein [Pyrinomonadaceae bacterium]